MRLTLPSPPGGGEGYSDPLSPQRRGQGEGWLAVGVGRLDGGRPERGVVAREDAAAHETGDRLEPLDRVHGAGRVPHDAGRDLLVDGLLPVAAIAGQDHGTRVG